MITGTLAIDYVGRYPGAFSALPRHRGINLSVQLDHIDRRFGGCAMNIAYTLKLLGQEPVPFVFVARTMDADYSAHLAAVGMDLSGVNHVDAPYSSHGFVFTDREQNQFTAFFGGPAADVQDFTPRLRRFAESATFDYAILAPDFPANMIAAAGVAKDCGIPFLTDPGQNLTDFSAADALQLVRLSHALIVNEHEYATLRHMVGDALQSLELLVVTEGERGAFWRSATEGDGRQPAAAATVLDPTGCGDAFRAGFVDARLRGATLRDATRAGGVTAATALGSVGGQAHRCDDFEARYLQAWGEAPAWRPALDGR